VEVSGMPTAFEEITLGYKVASLALEIGRSAGNQVKSWKNKSNHRFISSMTTLEITYDAGADQIAHYVQDRTVKITRDGVRMPPFTYGSDGTDTFGDITVVVNQRTTTYRHRILEEDGREKTIGTEVDRDYAKDTIVRCVLTAVSRNGFPADEESLITSVQDWTDMSTTFVIFPKEKLPKELEITFRKMGDDTWRQVTREKNELRQFTGGKKAFILEATNPPTGQKYKIAWRW
jgi:hypothetical protein